MSELSGAPSATDAADGGVAVTAGALLRDAREATGLHIAALAVALKVPVAKLEALEADNFAALPDMVFVRALASSVCRTLKRDPLPVLALLPQGEGPRLSSDDVGLNAPVKEFPGKSSVVPFTGPGSRPLVWAVGLLLIGAALMLLLPRGLDVDFSDILKQPGAAASISTPVLDVAQGNSAPVGVLPQPAAAAVADAVESTEPSGDASRSVASPSVVASAADTLPATDVAITGVLAFKARSESWIQVRDANGALVLQRNLASDEQVSVSGVLPLSVVIGRADATEVFVRGKPYDLGPVSRENVARFEVK